MDLTAPAAGANLSYNVAGQDWLRVIAATATLTTDATVASRLFSLDYIGGRGVTRVRNAAPVLVAASTAATVYQWDSKRTGSEWNTGTPVFVPLVDVLLEPGWAIRFTVDNIQSGDTITAARLFVERYWLPTADEAAA